MAFDHVSIKTDEQKEGCLRKRKNIRRSFLIHNYL